MPSGPVTKRTPMTMARAVTPMLRTTTSTKSAIISPSSSAGRFTGVTNRRSK